jgi:hypothetical protein
MPPVLQEIGVLFVMLGQPPAPSTFAADFNDLHAKKASQGNSGVDQISSARSDAPHNGVVSSNTPSYNPCRYRDRVKAAALDDDPDVAAPTASSSPNFQGVLQ